MTRRFMQSLTVYGDTEALRHLNKALKALSEAKDHIDRAGEYAAAYLGNDDCDMLACFASNTLEGSKSLIRELEAMVTAARLPKRKP